MALLALLNLYFCCVNQIMLQRQFASINSTSTSLLECKLHFVWDSVDRSSSSILVFFFLEKFIVFNILHKMFAHWEMMQLNNKHTGFSFSWGHDCLCDLRQHILVHVKHLSVYLSLYDFHIHNNDVTNQSLSLHILVWKRIRSYCAVVEIVSPVPNCETFELIRCLNWWMF